MTDRPLIGIGALLGGAAMILGVGYWIYRDEQRAALRHLAEELELQASAERNALGAREAGMRQEMDRLKESIVQREHALALRNRELDAWLAEQERRLALEEAKVKEAFERLPAFKPAAANAGPTPAEAEAQARAQAAEAKARAAAQEAAQLKRDLDAESADRAKAEAAAEHRKAVLDVKAAGETQEAAARKLAQAKNRLSTYEAELAEAKEKAKHRPAGLEVKAQGGPDPHEFKRLQADVRAAEEAAATARGAFTFAVDSEALARRKAVLLGVEVGPALAEAKAGGPVARWVYVLQDGTELPVTMSVELTDVYQVKGLDGVTRKLKKADVASVREAAR